MLSYVALRLHYAPFSAQHGSAQSILTEGSVWGSMPRLLGQGADALFGFRAQAMRSLAWSLEQPWTPGMLIALAAMGALFLGLLRYRDVRGAIYVAGAAATLAPTVVVSQTMWLGFDRYLYMPWILVLLGIAPHAAKAVDAWSDRRILRWSVVVALVLTATLGTITASQFYEGQPAYERSLLDDYPDDPTIHYYLASIAKKTGQPSLAQERFEKMPDPPWPHALVMPAFLLARELSNERMRDVAIRHGLEAYPDDAVLRAHGMRWHYQGGRVDEAMTLGRSFDANDALCPEVKRQLLIWARRTELAGTRSRLEASAAGLVCSE